MSIYLFDLYAIFLAKRRSTLLIMKVNELVEQY